MIEGSSTASWSRNEVPQRLACVAEILDLQLGAFQGREFKIAGGEKARVVPWSMFAPRSVQSFGCVILNGCPIRVRLGPRWVRGAIAQAVKYAESRPGIRVQILLKSFTGFLEILPCRAVEQLRRDVANVLAKVEQLLPGVRICRGLNTLP